MSIDIVDGGNMRAKSESGIALISALLILVLLGALLEGFILSINSDQKLIGVDRGQNQAFYGALAGLEQLTAGLGNLIDINYNPTQTQLNNLAATPPALPNMSFVSPNGQSGYTIVKGTTENRTIPSGPYEGLIGLITPYRMTTTAHTVLGGQEVRMSRDLQVVLIPVFQFGIFSETDLSFFAGPNFDFGGRVHTNGSLYLAEGDNNTLTMSKRITAFGSVIRDTLSNGWNTSSSYTGHVSIAAPGQTPNPRDLAQTEGSSNANWTNISMKTYNGNIRNGTTGVRRMDLPIATAGGTPIEIIRRPLANEEVDKPGVYGERNFAFASMHILLSDTPGEITTLPYVSTNAAPVHLSGTLADGQKIGESTGSGSYYKTLSGTSLIDGFIKIEIQTARNVWQDVTAEILGLGVSGLPLAGTCTDPWPNSIIRVQRLKDNSCDTTIATNLWPNVLYDTREGALRNNIDKAQYNVYLGGVMHYIELDVNNLCRWFRTSANGQNAMHDEGFVVYFSDRRTNKNGSNQETGEYGNEDVVNSTDSDNGTPDGVLEPAEDVNGSGGTTPDVYGKIPRLFQPRTGTDASPLDTNALPTTLVDPKVARRNRAIFFRRALKLANGATISLGNNTDSIPFGLAIASENPVYVQGNYNAPGGSFDTGHVAASVIADAVTLLSNNWNDIYSFNCPHTAGSNVTTCNNGGIKPARVASNTSYRMAIIAGKGKSFEHPDGRYQDFGTDGGVHNFLRFLENWNDKSLNYRGSIINLYYSRQAVGTYKCGENDNVYSPPTRGYKFDEDFLTPALLPPHTPHFKDINITGFTQIKTPSL